MRYRWWMATLALVITLPAAAQIYRCQIDGTTAFSDRPCGPDSRPHSAGADISFVTPADNLSALGEAARAFIRQRRERQNDRASNFRPPGIVAIAPTAPARKTVYVPWPIHGHHRSDGHRDRPAVTPPRPAAPERYSPLNGPILGTRRDIWLFEDRSSGNPGDGRR